MSNTPQLQPSWRWPQWRYRSPQDVSAGHGLCHGDNLWKFPNDVIVWGTTIILRSVKPIGNEKEWWVSHYGVVYKPNLIPNVSRITDWSVHYSSYHFHSTGTFAVNTDIPLGRLAGLKFTHRGQASRTGPMLVVRLLSGVPDLWNQNKFLRGGDLSHLHVPDCIWVFFYFVWFVFIHHNFQFYFELYTYCNILDIYLL